MRPPFTPREVRELAGVSIRDWAKFVRSDVRTLRKYESDALVVSPRTGLRLREEYVRLWVALLRKWSARDWS